MKVFQRICALLAFGCIVSASSVSEANFHRWVIKEIYSNHDGSVQFIELFTAFGGEHVLDPHPITATSTVGGTPTVTTFEFPSNLSLLPPNPPSTANRHMLIATPGFGALAGGVTPDFDLIYTPTGGPLFNADADTVSISFAHSTDVLTIAGSAIPRDGVNSLTDTNLTVNGPDNFVSGTNSPTNFRNIAGSVNLPPPSGSPADFNGDGDVDGVDLTAWRGGFGATGAGATNAAGNADADSDVDGADLLIWQREVTSGAVVAIPEPASAILAALAIFAALAHRKR